MSGPSSRLSVDEIGWDLDVPSTPSRHARPYFSTGDRSGDDSTHPHHGPGADRQALAHQGASTEVCPFFDQNAAPQADPRSQCSRNRRSDRRA